VSTAPMAPVWLEDGIEHIDVRALPPPEPLVAILRRVRELGTGASLIVHHNRVPVLLFPELAEIGWEAEEIAAPAGEVRLLLRAMP
jgi:TusA-related sulfurtransferase